MPGAPSPCADVGAVRAVDEPAAGDEVLGLDALERAQRAWPDADAGRHPVDPAQPHPATVGRGARG